MDKPIKNTDFNFLITVDVEDWFQVENFKPLIDFTSWDKRELRVERNVHQLLDLLDDAASAILKEKPPNEGAKTKQANSLRATFFVLGWIAKKCPQLIREIHTRGHEIASHGFNHDLCGAIPTDQLSKDIRDSKKLLEDVAGCDIIGYRAPSFSINDNILNLLNKSGYCYDSSYNSFSLHGRYGHCSACKNLAQSGRAIHIGNQFYEIPISNIQVGKMVVPWGGGAYFRLLPYLLFKGGVQYLLNKYQTYVLYLHPWELDPGQPYLSNAPLSTRLRHYTNLKKTPTRLKNLLFDFRHCQFITCQDYIRNTVTAPILAGS